jgi:hypothetical protein
MENTPAGSNWDITANRYVAYCDIIGFKDIVSRSPHDEIYELMKNINAQLRLTSTIEWFEKSTELIKTTTYSDSIIIYSKDD